MTRRLPRSFTLALLVAPCVGLLAAAGVARAEVIERVVAVVNDDAILLSDLRRRAAPMLEVALADAETRVERTTRLKALYRRIIDQLIDEQLVEQAARKMHTTVGSREVDQAIENVRRQNNMSEEQFWQAVEAQGFTEKQYKSDVRKQLLRLKVVNQRVRSRVNITEDVVRDAYDDRVRSARRSQRFRAAHVFTPLSSDASATEVAKALAGARQLRSTLTADNFDAHAEQSGGDLGWLDQGDLPPVLEDALLGLSVGEISEPVRGPAGIHIFLVRERQQGDAAIPSFDEARADIQRELLDQAMTKQEKLFITGLRRDAIVEVRE